MPWATVNYYDSPAGAAYKSVLQPGDIIYVCDGVSEGTVSIRSKKGSAAMPYALIAYPGAQYNWVGITWWIRTFAVPQFHKSNIWYNGGDSNPAAPPAWDTRPISDNPEFVDADDGDFRLSSNSPARNAGITP